MVMQLYVGTVLDLQIASLARGGHGVARHDGLVIFVPYGVPGDLVRCKIFELRKNFAYADLLQVLTPSEKRVEAPCPVFGTCGGCSWQNVAYEEQLRQKQMILEESFRKARVSVEEGFLPFVASPKIFNYRNRIQVRVKSGLAGFSRRKSHELVAVRSCDIAEQSISDQLANFGLNQKDGRYEIRGESETEGIRVSTGQEDETLDSRFSQVNSGQNEALIETVLKALGEHKTAKRMLELYAGGGNFSFPIVERFPDLSMVSVELDAKAVEAAQVRLKKANLQSRFAFFGSDVGEFLKTKGPVLGEVHVLLLDPPRAGCDAAAIKGILDVKPDHIFYISCDPQTLVRDLGSMKDMYKVVSVQGFDMFPHTDHIEVFAALQRI